VTAEEAVKAALSELAELGNSFPAPRAALYRRAGVRQRQLFALAATINPDWAGVCATGSLIDGKADLRELMRGQVTGVPRAEHLSRVEVMDPGSSGLAAGQAITLVPSDDYSSGLAPRMFVRNWGLYGVASDLDGVTSVRIHYSRVPEMPVAAGDVLELPEPHTEVLVFDLARDLLNRATALTKEVRQPMLDYVVAREKEAEEAFRTHVATFVASTNRFASVA